MKSDRADSAGYSGGMTGSKSSGSYGSPKGSSASSKSSGSQHKGMNKPEMAKTIQARMDRPVAKPQARPQQFRSRMTEEDEARQAQRQRQRTPSPDWMGPKQPRIHEGVLSRDILANRMVPSFPGLSAAEPRSRKKGEVPTPTPRPERGMPKSPGLLGKPVDRPQSITRPLAGGITADMMKELQEMRREFEGPRQNRGRFGPQPPPAKSVPEREASAKSRSGYRGGRS